MSAGKIRGKLLVELWLAGKPMTLQVLSEKIGFSTSSTMGYLLGLIKAKYVFVPQKHNYAITSMGKQAIGLPSLTKELAQKILDSVSVENAFHFYFDIDDYSGIYADSLKDFVDKFKNLELKTVLFHFFRKDFENWVRFLGDVELSKKLGIIRIANTSEENLRKELFQTLMNRCKELEKLTI
ncbi:hypothetical protein KJN74_01075 [Candidatus Bathyarchaeota archaeon]|nr:hypothetical protein [Candidatus Bathyarchaeota archaeon]